ncbi:MAG: OmpH family outer membrane protein [Porphyromonadaceae bacterium]|nr:OmpH family outer membrane protein [Porphyromonadaceae bacterium]
MKRIILFVGLLILCGGAVKAQKFALIDMEYILKNIPSYEMANEQLKQISLRWEKEISDQAERVEEMYKEYQADAVFLTSTQKQQKEEEILAEDKATQELRRKYFGPEGELYKKRESLIKPIQDDIYEAVKSISDGKGYQMVIDRSSSSNIIFASPRIDISNEVLAKLGYSK